LILRDDPFDDYAPERAELARGDLEAVRGFGHRGWL